MSQLLIPKILEMLIMLLIGFAMRRIGAIREEESRGLSLVCLYVAVPCAILMGFQKDYSPDTIYSLLLTFAVVIMIHVIFLTISVALRRWLHLTPLERLSVIYPNCGNLVIPLVMAVLGTDYVIYSCVFIAVQGVFLWSHGASQLSGLRHINLMKVITNPNVIAFLVALVFFFTGVRLPSVLAGVCSTMSNFTAPLSMLVAGVLLGDIQLEQVRQYRRLPLVLGLRLLLMPVVMLGLFRLVGLDVLLGMDPGALVVCFICCCTPMASTVVQMTQLFKEDEAHYASVINALGLLLCILTIPLMVTLYEL